MDFINNFLGASRASIIDGDEEDDIHDTLRNLDETTVGEIIRSLLTNKEKSLEFFPEAEIGEALAEFVDKNSKSAFSDTITKWIKETHDLVLEDESITPESDKIRDFIKNRTAQLNESYNIRRKELKSSPSQSQTEDTFDPMQADTKENVKTELHEDEFVDENNDDGFMNDPPVSPKLEASPVKKETKKIRSRRSSVKNESPTSTPTSSRTRKSTGKRKM